MTVYYRVVSLGLPWSATDIDHVPVPVQDLAHCWWMTATGKDKHMKFRVYVFKYDETACSIMMLIVILFQKISI